MAAGDKFTSLLKLGISKVNVLPTIFAWRKTAFKNSRKIFAKLGDPVIAKDFAMQKNSQIYILRSVDDLARLGEVKIKEREGQFLFQKYIAIEREFRLLVLGGEVKVAHTKAKRDYSDFRVVDNSSEDNYKFIDTKEIPQEMKDQAVLAAKTLGIEIAGVDVCIEEKTGKVYVLEVNRGPGFEHDPKKSPELAELTAFFSRELFNLK